MNFFETLINPDKDAHPERGEVVHAANLLQIGEFQVLQLAFAEWFGREMTKAESDSIFDSFMVRSQVPPWARHYARKVIEMEASGELDINAPAYHRYDAEYFKSRLTDGARKFVVAVTILAGLLGGSLAMASYSAKCDGGVLPPCFERDTGPTNWGRADALERR